MTHRLAQMRVGELVVERPQRARVFERFGIDYCCGGRRVLQDVCRERGMPCERVVAELEAEQRENSNGVAAQRNWSLASLSELADHIVSRHHDYLRQELPRLALMIEKVARAHAQRDARLLKLDAVFRRFRAELESHMQKEEQILFPICRQLDSAGRIPSRFHCGSLSNPIDVMIHEHDDAGAALMEMYALTDGYTPPAEACNTYRALLSGLAELEQDMHQHVHLENNILFPRALETEKRIGAEAVAG